MSSKYVYSYKRDAIFESMFNAVWEETNQRWRIPFDKKLEVAEYLNSQIYDSESDSDSDIEEQKPHVKSIKSKTLHRAKSFDSLVSSSEDSDG